MMNQALFLQILMAFASIMMLIPYYMSFKEGCRRYMASELKLSGNNKYTFMYYSGFFISLIWFVMPFMEQPRMALNVFALFEATENVWGNAIYVVMLLVFMVYFMSVWGTKVMNYNLRATKDRFLHPSELVTYGPYAKVRNPMIMGDLFNHLSLVLLTGAVYTLCLYVVYIIIDIVIVEIENRYSVYVHFKKEYDEYAKRTPAYMNRELWLWTILYIAIIGVNFYL